MLRGATYAVSGAARRRARESIGARRRRAGARRGIGRGIRARWRGSAARRRGAAAWRRGAAARLSARHEVRAEYEAEGHGAHGGGRRRRGLRQGGGRRRRALHRLLGRHVLGRHLGKGWHLGRAGAVLRRQLGRACAVRVQCITCRARAVSPAVCHLPCTERACNEGISDRHLRCTCEGGRLQLRVREA